MPIKNAKGTAPITPKGARETKPAADGDAFASAFNSGAKKQGIEVPAGNYDATIVDAGLYEKTGEKGLASWFDFEITDEDSGDLKGKKVRGFSTLINKEGEGTIGCSILMGVLRDCGLTEDKEITSRAALEELLKEIAELQPDVVMVCKINSGYQNLSVREVVDASDD